MWGARQIPRLHDVDLKKPGFMSRVLRPVLLKPQGAVPQALTLPGGVRFIALCQRCPFLRECRRGSRHFWNHRAYLGNGPEPGFHNKKKAFCHTRAYVKRSTNTENCFDKTKPHSNWFIIAGLLIQLKLIQLVFILAKSFDDV